MKVWLGLLPGDDDLLDVAIGSNAVLDVTSAPALWGERLRGCASPVSAFVGKVCRAATNERHAHALFMADVVSMISSLQREYIDTLFLDTVGLSEFQLEGCMSAMRDAVQDGVVKHAGLYACSRPQRVDGLLSCGPVNPLVDFAQVDVGCWTVAWMLDQQGVTDGLVRASIARALTNGDVLVGVRNAHEARNALAAQLHKLSEDESRALEDIAGRLRVAV